MTSLKAARLSNNRLPVDASATPRTKRTLRALCNAWGLPSQVAMGAGELFYDINAGSRVVFGTDVEYERVVGEYPAYVYWQWVDPYDTINGVNKAANQVQALQAHADGISWLKEANRKGSMCKLNFAIRNYNTGNNSYDRDKDSTAAVTSIIGFASASTTGSGLTTRGDGTAPSEYKAWLDRVAASLALLVDDSGVPIPLMLRFFSEANGWYDYADVTVTGVAGAQGQSQITVQMPDTTGFSAGSFIRTKGLLPAAYNQLIYVTAKTSTTVTGNLFQVVNAGGAPTLGASPAIYNISGFWWAGRDRAAALVTVWQQTVAYLNTTKGLHNILWMWNMYPFYPPDKYFSSNPANSDAYGDFAYIHWWPGAAYVDIVSTDIYVRSGVMDFNNSQFVASMQTYADICDTYNKPFAIPEIGFSYDGQRGSGPGANQAGIWTDGVAALSARFPQNRMLGIWSADYIPREQDAAYPSFVAAGHLVLNLGAVAGKQ